jgi:hypothetical protein
LFLFFSYAHGKQNLEATMSKPDKSDLNPQSDADELEAAGDKAIAACGGDAREAVKALIVANQFLETDLEKVRAAVSLGYARERLSEAAKTQPPDRKGLVPLNQGFALARQQSMVMPYYGYA